MWTICPCFSIVRKTLYILIAVRTSRWRGLLILCTAWLSPGSWSSHLGLSFLIMCKITKFNRTSSSQVQTRSMLNNYCLSSSTPLKLLFSSVKIRRWRRLETKWSFSLMSFLPQRMLRLLFHCTAFHCFSKSLTETTYLPRRICKPHLPF